MTIGEIYTADILAAAPPAAVKVAPAKTSAWSAIPRGAAAGAVEMFADATGLRMRPDPEGRRSDFLRMPKIQADPAERQRVGEEMSRNARDYARSLQAEPGDASAAEAILFGAARGITKAATMVATAGPAAGAVAFGGSETASAYDDLTRKGVDGDTALKAAAGIGALSAVGVGLPMAGQTLRSTAALYVAGGPGGYVAQQALTREILQRGGYQKQAQEFDPFDPVGMAVAALVPLPFAAMGLRANRAAARAKAADVPSEQTPVAQAAGELVPREVVDAAMVSHSVQVRQRADDVAAMIPQRGTPVDSLAAFVERGGYKAPEPVKAPSGPDGFLAWVKAQGGLDIGQKLDITGDANGVRSSPAGIFRRGGISTDDLATRAASEGYLLPDQAGDSGAFVELVQRAVAGDRVLTMAQQMEKAARDHAEAQASVRLADLEDRLRLLGEDPAAARGNADAIDAYLAANEHRLLSAAMDEIVTGARQDSPEFDAMRERARQIAQDMEDGGRTLAQFEAEVEPLTPAMRRLVEQETARNAAPARQAPQPEAAAPARGAGAEESAPTAAPAGRPGAEVEAAGLTPGAKAEAQAAPARVDALLADNPDMLVMLDGMDKPMRLADFMAAVKAEADEMVADAPLMQVAAECALTNGFT
jgi:hypothetical protein